MSEIVSKTILQIKEGLKKREYSALEVTDAFNSASESNKKLNFYNTGYLTKIFVHFELK